MTPVLLSAATLHLAREFFEQRGEVGCEGTALLAGVPGRPIDHLVIPDQQAGPVPRCWVRVTAQGELDIAAALSRDERYVARIHSHPWTAFHSPTDDANPVLTHNGALSIVVPFFGLGLRRGLDACAVLRYHAGIWHDLPHGLTREEIIRVVAE
jgi:hypothetical protein